MASSQSTAPATDGAAVTATPTKRGKKRHHDLENDDIGQPSPQKRMLRKPCIVCAEDVPKNQFPKLPHKKAGEENKDDHSSDICFKCYSEHLGHEVKSKGHDEVGCPQCLKILDRAEVQKLASSFTYQEYLDKAAKKCMQQEEEYHACPNAECSWGAFFAKDDGNILSCQMCNARYCLACEVPFHEDQTCEEHQAFVQRRSEDEQKSLEVVGQSSRPCPNPDCGVNIDKYAGCDHVTCQRCHYEFCWECFAPYRGPAGIWVIGNRAHRETCRYSPNMLPNYTPIDDSDDDDDF